MNSGTLTPVVKFEGLTKAQKKHLRRSKARQANKQKSAEATAVEVSEASVDNQKTIAAEEKAMSEAVEEKAMSEADEQKAMSEAFVKPNSEETASASASETSVMKAGRLEEVCLKCCDTIASQVTAKVLEVVCTICGAIKQPDSKGKKFYKFKNVNRAIKTKLKQATRSDSRVLNLEINSASLKVSARASDLYKLPYDVLCSSVLSFLAPEDLTKFAVCSKQSQRLAEEGYVWKSLFSMKYPLSRLNANVMKDWKLCYLLEHNKTVDSLRCFHTKKTFLDDVMGIPINFTVNPKTRRVDYIHSSLDLMSSTAFFVDKIRTDVWGEKFELWLPLYFTGEHFKRALPMIKAALVKLSPESNSTRFCPTMVLDVLPKLMNTFVVLLTDSGLATSKKTFQGFTAIHRLFLALVHEFPQLQTTITQRLKSFMASPEGRHKHKVPSLGNLIALLTVSNTVTWEHFKNAYLSESFDRGVLWTCKKYPSLASVHGPNGTPEPVGKETARIKQTFQAMSVSLRLCMFHVFFLRYLCHGNSEDRANRYDRFFGQWEQESDKRETDNATVVSPYSLSHFQTGVTSIFAVTDWPQFFSHVNNACPPRQVFGGLLRQAIQNSLNRGYHRNNTNFAQIQASGVSNILRKGQSHSVIGDLEELLFTDSWTFENGTKFLDATCILYSKTRQLEYVDYCHTKSKNGAVAHSGDVMRPNGGSHTITINLRQMPPEVTSIIFVVSGFAGAKLKDILNPAIACTDPVTGTELCRYDLERHNKVDSQTAVVMCQLYKNKVGNWSVLAIGDSCAGDASRYDPIFSFIKKTVAFQPGGNMAGREGREERGHRGEIFSRRAKRSPAVCSSANRGGRESKGGKESRGGRGGRSTGTGAGTDGVCPYDSDCYCKKPEHIAKYHRQATSTSTSTGSDTSDVGPYGSNCCRKNPEHNAKYHSSSSSQTTNDTDTGTGDVCPYGSNCNGKVEGVPASERRRIELEGHSCL